MTAAALPSRVPTAEILQGLLFLRGEGDLLLLLLQGEAGDFFLLFLLEGYLPRVIKGLREGDLLLIHKGGGEEHCLPREGAINFRAWNTTATSYCPCM